MATLAAAAARQLATSSRISTARTSSLPSNIIHRRGLAGAADHHGPPKVNVWQDPLSPSKWKEEHFVIVSLSAWGLLIFGGYKFFTGGKGKKEEGLEAPSFRHLKNGRVDYPLFSFRFKADSSSLPTDPL